MVVFAQGTGIDLQPLILTCGAWGRRRVVVVGRLGVEEVGRIVLNVGRPNPQWGDLDDLGQPLDLCEPRLSGEHLRSR